MIINNNELQLLNLEGKVVGLTSGCFDLLHLDIEDYNIGDLGFLIKMK